MHKIFTIGDFCFSLSYPPEVAPPPHFLRFETPDGSPEYAYRITLTDRLPAPAGDEIASRPDIRIFRKGDLEQRLIGVKGRTDFYACYQETSGADADVFLKDDTVTELNVDPMFCSLLALERRMILRGALILHCAYLRYHGEAILFSAPSETGKTTQANLWERYRGSETINGDRSLLQCANGRWIAQGWPVCGTSEVCKNLATPIRAIVMLSQAKENHAGRLPAAAAFTQLYTQITVNSWDRARVLQTMDLIERLITQVPVYHLGCTISEDAVKCLERALDA